MCTQWEERQEKIESLRSEYSTVANHWRFSQGIRFILFGVSATAFSGLFGAYRIVLLAVVGDQSTAINRFLALLVPFVGLVLSFLVDAMERAIEHMLTTATLRGRAIESELNIKGRIFSDIGTGVKFSRRRFSVPQVMRVIFVLNHIAWAVLSSVTIWALTQ